jgi:anti-anti-sigma factor
LTIAHNKVANEIQSSEVGDRCPYPRPFPREFSGCPSYQAVTFTASDSSDRPLGTWLTCRHLVTGKNRQEPGGYYPQCSLGTTSDRLNWLALVSPARLEVVRTIQEEFDNFSEPHRAELRRAKTEVLESPRSVRAANDLNRVVSGYLGAVEIFIEERQERLEEVGLAVGPLLRLIEESSWAWARGRDLGPTAPSEGRLRAFGPAARAFLAPATESPWRREASGENVFDQGVLQISRTNDPPGLRLDGAIDASNAEALGDALEAAALGHGDVHLDLGGVVFCDLGGIRAILRAAESFSRSRQLVLHGVPEQFERTMQIAGWIGTDGIVVADRQSIDAVLSQDSA